VLGERAIPRILQPKLCAIEDGTSAGSRIAASGTK
jgi:hypothetical protein